MTIKRRFIKHIARPGDKLITKEVDEKGDEIKKEKKKVSVPAPAKKQIEEKPKFTVKKKPAG